MNSKVIGLTLLALSLLLFVFLFSFIQRVETNVVEQSCYTTDECKQLGATLSYSHLVVGMLFSIFSLGLYLVFFTRSEQALLEKLDREKNNLVREDKLKIVAMMLDPNEQKVFHALEEREGITQHLLQLKTNLSKATISQILSQFERRRLVKREPEGKTYRVYLLQEI